MEPLEVRPTWSKWVPGVGMALLQVPSLLPVPPHAPVIMGLLAMVWWHLYVIDCVPSNYELS